MPRETAHRRSTRVRTGNTLRDNPTSLVVAAPTTVKVRDEGAAQLAALADFAKAGMGFASAGVGAIEDRRKRGTQHAVEDYAAGLFDEEEYQSNRGYLRGREVLRARAEAPALIAGIKEKLIQNGMDEMTEDELSAAFNSLVREQLDPGGEVDGEAERAYLGEMADQVLAAETKLMLTHKLNTIQQARTAEEVDLVTATAEDVVNGSYDANELFSNISRMREQEERNPLQYQILSNLARQTGDTSILTDMPTHYMNTKGEKVATIKNIPEYQAKIMGDVAAIESANRTAASRALAEQRAAEAEAAESSAVSVAASVIDGSFDERALQAYASLPGAKSSTLTALMGFSRTERNDDESRAGDYGFQTNLRANLLTSDATLDDILFAHEAGWLGTGQAARDTAASLMEAYKSGQSTGGRAESTESRYWQGNIKQRYRADLAGPMGALDAGRMAIQLKALEEYHDRVVNKGEDPDEAGQAVAAKYDEILDQSPQNPAGNTASLTTQGSVGEVAAGTVLYAIRNNDRRALGSIGGEELAIMLAAGLLTPEQANAAAAMRINP